MPRSRLCGAAQVTSSPPISICPESGKSKPATAISRVVLPDPDGPSSARNSPGLTSIVTSLTATTLP